MMSALNPCMMRSVVPVVHLSTSLFTGPKPVMLAVPFPLGSLTTVKLGKLPLHTMFHDYPS